MSHIVDVHQFTLIPRAETPRSTFVTKHNYKTTFDAGYLVPVHVEEVLPGDYFDFKMTGFARLATPIFPIMDNLYLDTFFFYVPYRLVWDNFKKLLGEQRNPGDSIDFLVPQIVSPQGGYDVGSLFDYMGLPTKGTTVGATNTFSHSALMLRAYNLIWNEWYRDENLQTSLVNNVGDGPDLYTDYTLLKRGKRKDYFTSCLPWPQKGDSVLLPIGVSAPIRTSATDTVTGVQNAMKMASTTGGTTFTPSALSVGADGSVFNATIAGTQNVSFYPRNLYADLASATSATINQLRQAFQVQKLLERDARGGTRVVELIKSHFNVQIPDLRLLRPEYLGGGTTLVNINPVVQTSATGTYANTPLATLSAIGTAATHNHGFKKSFAEHGIVIGLVNVRAELTYQQGLHKMWSRRTRYDFYWPAFAMLGEQTVLNKEIYCTGDVAQDSAVFGYQERWAEYRYYPSYITGQFRSTYTTPLDAWHLAQNFTALPTLNATFIQETPPLERVLAVGAAAAGHQLIFDSYFHVKKTRLMPMYSVPGLIDHF